MSDKKSGRIENPVFDQSRRRIKEDRLKPEKELQDRQHELGTKQDKKNKWPIIIITITGILTLLVAVATFYWNFVKDKNNVAAHKQQVTIKDTRDIK